SYSVTQACQDGNTFLISHGSTRKYTENKTGILGHGIHGIHGINGKPKTISFRVLPWIPWLLHVVSGTRGLSWFFLPCISVCFRGHSRVSPKTEIRAVTG